MSLQARVVAQAGAFTLAAELVAASGEAVALVGPNGAGKSTLGQCLAGLVPLADGEVVLDGEVLERPADGIRLPPQQRGVGMVFQDRLLFPALCARDNIAFGLVAQGLPRSTARATANGWLERVGLSAQGDLRPAQLSGGQAQRVALARALATQPRLLVLDEPFAALDADARRDLRRLVAGALTEGGGVKLLITHDPLDALTLAGRVVIVEGGRVVQTGTAEEIRRRPGSAYVATFVGLNYLRGTLRQGPGGPSVDTGDGQLRVASTDLPDGTPVVATVHPRAVLLSLTDPATSARNALSGPIAAVDRLDDRVRVTIACRPPLIAEVTEEALTSLRLVEGTPVWALVKATEIDVQAEGT
jgi:molybdate transport system ATP-binding protein